MYAVILFEIEDRSTGYREISRWSAPDVDSAKIIRNNMINEYRAYPRCHVDVKSSGAVVINFSSGKRQMITVERG